MLAALIDEDKEQAETVERYRAYTAQVLWEIDTILQKWMFDIQNTMPQYIDLIKPDDKPKSNMTSKEIVQRTLELFKVG